MYLRKHQQFDCYTVTNNYCMFNGHTVSLVPERSIPVDVNLGSNHISLLPYRTATPVAPTLSPITFQQTVQHLPTWERDLLQHTHLIELDATGFTQRLLSLNHNSTISLLACSDGSAPAFCGTFGWKCSLSTGVRSARGRGPAPGYRTSSFRAEAYRLLSFLRFLFRNFEYSSQPLPLTEITVYSDSKSVLDKVQSMLHWPYYFPNQTIAPDWDVLQAIVTSVRLFPRLHLRHVKGHQDSNTVYNSLPLEAQLNVEANHLAGSFQYPPTILSTHAPLISGCGANLHFVHGTITGHTKSVLQRHATTPNLHSYIAVSNNWDEDHCLQIDWTSHRQSLCKWDSRQLFVIKFIHDWLPLGNLLKKYNQNRVTHCPHCNVEDKTLTHFLCCPGRSWHNTCLLDLQQHCRSVHSDPILVDLLLTSLRQWLASSPVILPGYPDCYTRLITQQQQIGWEQLLFGRFVLAWSTAQTNYLHQQNILCQKSSGPQGVSSIIDILWRHIHQLWKARNDAYHGIDTAAREAVLASRTRRDTADLYARHSG